jgi:hypothetical protein
MVLPNADQIRTIIADTVMRKIFLNEGWKIRIKCLKVFS